MSPAHSATTRYGNSKALSTVFGMTGQLLERRVGILGPHDLHHLDLVELVLANHAARVLARGARLRAKTRRVRHEFERQALGAP